jgi:subtilisin family serine protease
LVGDAYDPASTDPNIATPHPDPNPLDCGAHGSHVAGTAAGSGVLPDGSTFAGPYDASTFSRAFRIGPGVAPKADLYAVRVFGCEGATDVVIDGIEWAVDNDMDVINMSLGSDFGEPDDASAVAARNAVRSGVIVASAAGNAGGGFYIESSPASGDGVLSVAATDATPSFPGATFTVGSTTFQAQNSNGAAFADGTTYPVVVLGSPGAVGLGCTAAEYARPDVPGALVVTQRGTCDRVARATLGQAAGAAAVALLNTDPGFPPFEGDIAGVTIPFFGIRQGDGPTLTAASSVTVANAVLANPGFKLPASFSSGGPRFEDSELKPNVIAPGVSVVSTAMGTGNGAVTFSGTSMATPVVAGVAALARQAHPTWKARDIATAISNTADPGALASYSTRLSGAGVPQALAVVQTGATAVSDRSAALSFGFVELRRDAHLREEITVRNFEKSPMVFDVSIPAAFEQGVPHTARASERRIRVAGQDRTTFFVDVNLPVPATDPLAFSDFAGVVELSPINVRSNHGVKLHVPYYGVARPVANLDGELEPPPRPKMPTGKLEVENRRSAIPGTADLYALGIQSDKDKAILSCNDVRALGVQSVAFNGGDRLLVFAFDAWRRCSNSAVNEYDVLITNENGEQFAVVGIDSGFIQSGSFTGELATVVINIQTGDSFLLPAFAPTDSATVQLVAFGSLLGLTQDKPRFAYQTQTFNAAGQGNDAPPDVATFNAFASSIVGQGQFASVDRNTTTFLPIGVDAAEFAQTPATGLMVLFLENRPGTEQAELLPFRAFAP